MANKDTKIQTPAADTPVIVAPVAPITPVTAPAKNTPERKARWEAFLVKAREINPERFDAQKANKEFDTIPDDFK